MNNKMKKILSLETKPLKNKKSDILINAISKDILLHGKIPFCLFFFIVITAVIIVATTHRARLLIAKKEQLIIEHEALENEWRNLVLKKSALGDHSRIERIAKEKLQMQYVDSSQENIVIKLRNNTMHKTNVQ